MTIRSRLLLLLLPALSAFVGLIALFFYLNWSDEILENFQSRLQSTVTATASSINAEDIEWIDRHLNESDLKESPKYQQIKQKLIQLRQKLPIGNLYVVKIEPVKEGEQVLLHDTDNPVNQIHNEHDPSNAYRQVFLLDASDAKQNTANQPGDIDFSETDEHRVYFTKKTFVTPIYEARKTHERFMSAYAPILNSQNEVVALVGADVSTQEIDKKLYKALLILSLGTCLTILMIAATVFFIADRISKPVQKLNQAALDIAAGNYEADIHVQGPKEIVELANTLNTMSECLVEHINRLRESSLIRERMYGEYECSLLLQHYMFQKVVDTFKYPHFDMRAISLNLSTNQKGLLLKYGQGPSPSDVTLTLLEAKEQGFSSLYELSQWTALSAKAHDYPFIECQLIKDGNLFRYKAYKLFPPFIWSTSQCQFVKDDRTDIPLYNQDMIFLCNSGFNDLFETIEKMEIWLGKVLRHFAEDGLETIQTMLTNELNFLAKKEHLKKNFHILALQVTAPSPIA